MRWFTNSFWVASFGFSLLLFGSLWFAITKGYSGATPIDAGEIQKLRAERHKQNAHSIDDSSLPYR